MRNCSPPRSTRIITNYTIQDNCDCLCHFPEECKLSNINCESCRQNNDVCQKLVSIHCMPSCDSNSPSPPRINSDSNINRIFKKYQRNMSSDCLCICENMCSCPCHSVTCICCPCGKDRQDAQASKINYYKNLYEQVKSELECEKRKNDKMMYDKQMQKNDLQSFENEQKNLLSENERLKQKLEDAMQRLEQEEENNNKRDQELFEFKQQELPKLQESYENLIKKIKDENANQINYLKNQLNNLSKENVTSKFQLKRKLEDERNSLDKIIEDLNNELNDLKMELDNKNNMLNDLKNVNDDLNNQLEDITSRYNKDIKDLKNQNTKLNQTIQMNLNDIKK